MPSAWTENDTEKLIVLYGQYQCLWNPFHPEFSNKSSRYKAYKEIKSSIDAPGLTICDCIERIAGVKKEYCYELSKIAAAIFCEKLYSPKAKWFKGMHVLLFPYKSTPRYNNFRKLGRPEQKFNDSGTQDNFLHSPLEKSDANQICTGDTCGACKPQEIELHLTLRDSIHSAPKLRDASTSFETIRAIDVATGTSNGVAENETQTDMLHERQYIARIKEEKDYSARVGDISVDGRRKTEDNFDIFGKSIAFQLRTIDIKTAVELQKEIQNLIAKARLETLESKLMNQSVTSICCCDCSDCKIMCKDETCSCGLTLKECLLLTRIKGSKGFATSSRYER